MPNTRMIEEIIANMRYIDKLANEKVKKPSISAAELKRGLEVSKLATAHPKEVAMTPYMKNMLVSFGDLKSGERLLTDSKVTRAEKWLVDTCKTILLKQCGKVYDEYDDRKPMDDPEHYFVDCYLNLNEKKIRKIQPGQVEEINEMIDSYAEPTPVIDLVSKLRKDPVFAKAVEVIVDHLPSVSASRKIVEVNLPFQTKHTNVGYIGGNYVGFVNDRTLVPGTDMTGAQLTMKIAEKLKDDFDALYDYNWTTEFARYQYKGRLIQAISRIPNLVMNQLESVEIQTYKAKCSLFAGYNDATYLKKVLTECLNTCKSLNMVMYNIDYHRYDKHVVRNLIILMGAISMYKCADERSRKLAATRAALMTKTWLIAGTKGKVVEVFGRIFSGFIDTNRGGGVMNAINMTYLVMLQDQHFIRDIVSQMRYWMLVMGDDNLVAVNPKVFSLSKLQTDAKMMNFEIDDPAKLAFGVKFLQYRVFEWKGRLVMIYPWTRVLLSALMKERASGLGPCGWTLSTYQQLAKLMEAPEFLAPVVNIIAYFDEQHLMLDKTIAQITEGVKAEDAEAAKKDKRATSTSDRLFDGDPSKAEQFNADGTIKASYFEPVQAAIKAVYDPQFFSKLSIAVPKLVSNTVK